MTSPPPTPVFIVGCPRSGTTIAASLLNRLPRVHISKETGFIGQSADLLQNVSDPATLKRLVDVANSWLSIEQWETRASIKGFQNFCAASKLSGAAAFVHYVWQLESPVAWSELEFIGDNTPLYVTCIPMLQRLFPNARFIHLVRDPRDVACSIVKMRFGSADLMAAAFDWHMTIACWLMATRTIVDAQRIECRYEDLCTSPEATFGQLAEFLGRNRTESDAVLKSLSEPPHSEDPFRKVARLPHHSRLTEPLSPARVARYRTELPKPTILQLEQILQNGMQAYGYEFTEWQVSPFLKDDRLFTLQTMLRDAWKRCWRRFQR